MKASIVLLAMLIVFAQFAAVGDVTLARDPGTDPELVGYQIKVTLRGAQFVPAIRIIASAAISVAQG